MSTPSLANLEQLNFEQLTQLEKRIEAAKASQYKQVKTQAQQIREDLLVEMQAKLIQACRDLGLPASKVTEIAGRPNGGHKARVAKMRVRAKGKRKFNKAPARYRDGAGNEWSGRGHTPQWMRKHERQGHPRAEFLVPGA